MILVRDEKKRIRCAKCYEKLKDKDVVKDRFLPASCSYNISTSINYVGVCKACHKIRLKKKVRFPSYWNYLSDEQRYNMTCHMRGARMQLQYEADDDETLQAVLRL